MAVSLRRSTVPGASAVSITTTLVGSSGAAGPGPARVDRGEPTTTPSAATLRRARARLRWFALNVECRSEFAFMSPPPQRCDDADVRLLGELPQCMEGRKKLRR